MTGGGRIAAPLLRSCSHGLSEATSGLLRFATWTPPKTFERLQGRYACSSRGKPREACGVTGVQSAGLSSPDRRTDLLERESELEQIGAALRGAAAGSGAIVVVGGAAGIGKSSLLGAARELAETGRMTS